MITRVNAKTGELAGRSEEIHRTNSQFVELSNKGRFSRCFAVTVLQAERSSSSIDVESPGLAQSSI
jgi:hypothetical protein